MEILTSFFTTQEPTKPTEDTQEPIIKDQQEPIIKDQQEPTTEGQLDHDTLDDDISRSFVMVEKEESDNEELESEKSDKSETSETSSETSTQINIIDNYVKDLQKDKFKNCNTERIIDHITMVYEIINKKLENVYDLEKTNKQMLNEIFTTINNIDNNIKIINDETDKINYQNNNDSDLNSQDININEETETDVSDNESNNDETNNDTSNNDESDNDTSDNDASESDEINGSNNNNNNITITVDSNTDSMAHIIYILISYVLFLIIFGTFRLCF